MTPSEQEKYENCRIEVAYDKPSPFIAPLFITMKIERGVVDGEMIVTSPLQLAIWVRYKTCALCTYALDESIKCNHNIQPCVLTVRTMHIYMNWLNAQIRYDFECD
ncbi:unnamed protein product [Pieris macdunnoughi]|uniref:Uncharacterized protein n=1 Tax=Pieris macdunnoughi TaxID=345717 RepID=A0A821PRR8_9NEOP|nr:unnamed protein product [Pieris macdunnoughi]